MPKVTEAHLEARKQQILDAAAACFSRKGFHQTTMQDICREADLSPGAFYRYFESKEGVIEAMVVERRQKSMAIVETALGHSGNTLGILDELANVFFQHLGDSQGCALDIELWAEAQSNPRVREAVRLDVCEVNDALVSIISEAQARGEINPLLEPRAVAEVMNSFFFGLILQRSLSADVEVSPYVSAIKAMMNGHFWQKPGKESNPDVEFLP
jgi:TetR/AcrR family transcriptional regulator, repressor for uid operon